MAVAQPASGGDGVESVSTRTLTELWASIRLGDVTGVASSLAAGAAGFGGQLLGLPSRLPSLLGTTRLGVTLTGLLDWDRLHEFQDPRVRRQTAADRRRQRQP